jgi:predicted outer membrane repeat protein
MKTRIAFTAATLLLLFLISCEWETTQPVPPPTPKVFHVPSDKATIQDAIDAIDKSEIGWEIIVAKGTYNSEGFWDLDFDGRKFIELRSESGSDSTIINLKKVGQTHRAFSFNGGEDTTTVIRGFTFKSGIAPGDENTQGGAVFVFDAYPLFVDCVFSRNTGNSGGAVYSDAAKPIFDSCKFIENSSELGGAAYCASGKIHLRNCIFEENSASSGGAIYAVTSTPIVTGSLFDHNAAVSGDGLGGVIFASQSSPFFENCIFIENSSVKGGVLYSSSGTGGSVLPRFTDCTLVGNDADSGSALFAGVNSALRFNSTMIAFGTGGLVVELSSGSKEPIFECCDIFGNEGGDWDTDSILAAQADIEGNMSLDPLLCDIVTGDMRLQIDSPCLPDNNECGIQIGAQVGICE